jgi:hypothetical protein
MSTELSGSMVFDTSAFVELIDFTLRESQEELLKLVKMIQAVESNRKLSFAGVKLDREFK